MAEDLAWLDEYAFECIVMMNNHRPNFYTVAQLVADGEIDDEDWTDPAAKANAITTNRLVEVIVYPCGSVSSFAIYGTDLATVMASAREHCAGEQARWRNNGMVPLHQRPDVESPG